MMRRIFTVRSAMGSLSLQRQLHQSRHLAPLLIHFLNTQDSISAEGEYLTVSSSCHEWRSFLRNTSMLSHPNMSDCLPTAEQESNGVQQMNTCIALRLNTGGIEQC